MFKSGYNGFHITYDEKSNFHISDSALQLLISSQSHKKMIHRHNISCVDVESASRLEPTRSVLITQRVFVLIKKSKSLLIVINEILNA